MEGLAALEERIRRLDALIEERADGHRGLGLRLALGMALELRRGLPPGTETGELVGRWQLIYPEEWVEEAIAFAGVLLRDPARMTQEIEGRLREKGLLSESASPEASTD
jgi:hypothetical protein